MEQMLEFITENYIWIIIIGIVVVMTIIGYIADKTDFGKQSMSKSKKEKISKNEVEEIEETEEIVDMEPVTENVEEIPTQDLLDVEDNVAPAFDTDEMFNLEDSTLNLENVEYPEDQAEETSNEMIEEQPVEVLDKKTLKKMQKEEAKRLKEEAKKLKEEEKRLKKEAKKEKVEEIKEEPEMENFYDEQPVQMEQEVETSSDLFEPMEDVSLDVPNTDFDMEIETPVEEVNEEPETENFYTEEVIDMEPTFTENVEEMSTEELSNVEESEDVIDEIQEIELPSIESLDKELNDYEEEDDVWKF